MMIINDNKEILNEIEQEIASIAEEETPVVEFGGVVGEKEPERPEPTIAQLNGALDHVEEVFDRALSPFMLIGENGRGLYEYSDPFFYSKNLHIGLRKIVFYHYVAETLKALLPKETLYHDDFISYEFDGVLIRIDLLPDESYFEHPDVRFYNHMSLLLPNPFNVYYEEAVLPK